MSMNKPLTIRMWIDGSLVKEFATSDESWLDTGYVKIHEGNKIFVYDGRLSKGRVISFVYHSEPAIKEAFNLDSLEMANMANMEALS